MDTLDLTVEDAFGIEYLSRCDFPQFRKLRLGAMLGAQEGLPEFAVLGERLQLGNLAEIGDPRIADRA